MTQRLEAIERDLKGASSIDELRLLQERRNLQSELAAAGSGSELSTLEGGFVAVAKAYSEHKGISYATWREFGVPAAVLSKAGISRSR